MMGTDVDPILSSHRPTLRAMAEVILPGPEALDEAGWRRTEAIMEGALGPRPSSVKRQLQLFLRLLNLFPLVTTGRTLRGLPPERRTAFLESLQRSRLAPLRRGLWGVRTLLFMGYYNQDSVRQEIGYRAHPRGWAARDEEEGP
jgi:hypothetical protein